MIDLQGRVPDVLPVLARGKHRNPRKGACFMELASYLAGERWSDHPACTHPLLAALARHVNDLTTDEGRPRLAPLIPSVIGLTGDDARIDAAVALRCATLALPVVAEERQRALAVSVLVSERVLARLEGRPSDEVSAAGRAALASVPLAARWAREFTRRHDTTVASFRRHSAPNCVRLSATGASAACVADPDGLLLTMLSGAIIDCAALVRRDAARATAVDTGAWRSACELSRTGRRR